MYTKAVGWALGQFVISFVEIVSVEQDCDAKPLKRQENRYNDVETIISTLFRDEKIRAGSQIQKNFKSR
jgi:hypothetical protein